MVLKNLLSDFIKVLKPIVHYDLTLYIKNYHKIKLGNLVLLVSLIFAFGVFCGFWIAKFEISKAIFSSSVFAAVFGSLILVYGYYKTNSKKEKMEIIQRKLKIASYSFVLRKESDDEAEAYINEVVRYFNSKVLISLNNFLIEKKLGLPFQKSFNDFQYELTADSSFIPNFTEKLKVKIFSENITRRIYWLLNAPLKDVKIYKALISPIFISTTDTIPGIFCRFEDSKSAERIFSIKGRDPSKPLAIYSANPAKFILKTSLIREFLTKFEGKPFTLVTKPSVKIPKYALKDGMVGVRFTSPSSKFYAFLKENSLTLLGTSANKSNEKSPNSISEIPSQIKGELPILDFQESQLNHSTVLKFEESQITVLREGEGFEEVLKWLESKNPKINEDKQKIKTYIFNL